MSWTEPDFSPAWKSPQKLALTPPITTSSDLHVQPQFDNNSTTKVYAPRGGTASIYRVPCEEFGRQSGESSFVFYFIVILH